MQHISARENDSDETNGYIGGFHSQHKQQKQQNRNDEIVPALHDWSGKAKFHMQVRHERIYTIFLHSLFSNEFRSVK